MEPSRRPAPGRIEFMHRSWPADSQQLAVIRRELSGWLAPLALTELEVADVVLAVDEAAANAVRHAYGPDEAGVVELTLWTESETLCIEVVDHGSWRPPSDRPTEVARDPADEPHVRVGAHPLRRPRQPRAPAAPDPRPRR